MERSRFLSYKKGKESVRTPFEKINCCNSGEERVCAIFKINNLMGFIYRLNYDIMSSYMK